jgi:lysine-ketoglutarate reductase/saccharopine dehydrogenase-like protein (TIGR00300 family)
MGVYYMSFKIPRYTRPDFTKEPFYSSPNVKTGIVTIKGTSPQNYHATSIYPEYFKINGKWILAPESRMDCVVVLKDNYIIEVKEFRNLNVNDIVVLGRSENGEEGIYIQVDPFSYDTKSGSSEADADPQCFTFRAGRSRETTFSRDYDNLYKLLEHEKEHGYIIWVLGPAIAFDHDSKNSMENLISNGYAHAIFAGNALAVHDIEGSLLGTALGQDIYTQNSDFNSHYNHIDVINMVRKAGSIENFIEEGTINKGIVYSCIKNNVPLILAGSIRDDGPLPGVISDVYESQEAMRTHCKKATTVICLATMLHTIATGNMTPMYKVEGQEVRPVYIYTVDISEFAVNKLRDRGSLEITSIVTNVQDFVVNIDKNVSSKT